MTFKLSEFTVAQLKQVIAIKEQIEKLEYDLNTILGGISSDAPIIELDQPGKNAKKAVDAGLPKRKRTMSKAARAKIAAAAKARWAKHHANKKA